MPQGLSIQPYSAALAACAFVSLLMSARSWFGSRKALSRGFGLYHTTIFVWSLFRLIQFEVVSPEAQFQALQLQYMAFSFFPGCYYMIARAMSRRPMKGIELPLVFLLAFLAVPLVATSSIHHFFWIGNPIATLPMDPRGGWAFWVFAGLGYGQILTALALITRKVFRARGALARWNRVFVGLLYLPVATNAVFLFALIDRTAYDPTPIAFAVAGLLMAFATRRFDILEAVPYAKNVVLESIETPILVLDEDAFVVGANNEARDIFSFGGDIEGESIEALAPELAAERSEGESTEWSRGGVDYQVTSYAVKRGRERWRGRIFLFRDVSAIVRAKREVEEARAKADAANAAKSAFVAVVSHELRNPLNAIIGLADLDLGGDPPSAIRDDLEVILSSGKILLGLVNDLLDHSKIEAGKLELEKIDFDLHEQVVSLLKVFGPAVQKKGIYLDIVVEESTPRYVKGDPLRYGQVLMNLVSNAVKFTERGAITVSLMSLEAPQDGDERDLLVLTAVSDTGMGIGADKLPRLFREFSQADPSVSRRFGGTGLGLSISKRLVALFGGEIEVQSVEGKGSTFSFTTRFQKSEEAKAKRAVGVDLGSAGLPRLRVLVVDDDPVNSAVAKRYIERAGHHAVPAATASLALDRLRRGGLDLVLLDLVLPDMDGFEASGLIKAESSSSSPGGIPIAAMTARVEPGVRAACASAGMIDCLSKPLDPAALYRLLDRVASSARELGPRAAASVRAARVETAVDIAPAAVSGGPLIEEAALLERLDGDRAFMLELLGYFIEEAPQRRLALSQAIALRDLEAVQRLCHALKGSSLSLRAVPLGAKAGELERTCIVARRSPTVSDEAIAAIEGAVVGLSTLLSETVTAAQGILSKDKK